MCVIAKKKNKVLNNKHPKNVREKVGSQNILAMSAASKQTNK